jgi:molybdopterin converting factor small subunit
MVDPLANPRAAIAKPGDRDPVHVTLPPALLRLFPKAEPEVTLAAGTISELVDRLDARWPGMRDRLVDSRPAIRQHINVFVEGRRARLDAQLSPGAKVFIITAVSGG